MSSTSTTLITGAGAITTSVVASNVGSEEQKSKNRKMCIGTSLATTATYISGEIISAKYNNDYQKQKAEQSRQSYVSSLSDEEIALALEKLEGREQLIESSENIRRNM